MDDKNRKHSHTPEPDSPFGAMFYAILGGLVVALVVALLHHVQITWR